MRITYADSQDVAWHLDELLDAGAAAAITGQGGTEEQRTVHPTVAARDIGRLGLLLWLERTNPLPLDQGSLDAEIAAAYSALPGQEAAAERSRRARAAMPAVLVVASQLPDTFACVPPDLARSAYRVAVRSWPRRHPPATRFGLWFGRPGYSTLMN